LWVVLKISSDSLPVVDKRLIGRKFGSLTGKGRVIIFASFQDVEK
jgi:hypothetical protein